MPEGRWTYRMCEAEPREDDPTLKELRRAIIVSPAGYDVLIIERTRRFVDVEAEDICRLLNISRACLAEGVVFA